MAKPKLALVPSAQGDKFYSVLPSSGVGDFDFTRSGGATRINSQGLIETVADGVSRLNYPLIDGKVVGCPSHLLEDSATNLITYSEDFTQSAWAKLNGGTGSLPIVTSNNSISPDGTQNADKIVLNKGNASSNSDYSLIRLDYGGSDINGTSSVYLKSDVNVDIEISSDDISYKTISVTTKWKRFEVSDATSDRLSIGLRGTEPSTSNATIYAWGAQLEQGSFATSYIPSLIGSQTTRSAETANNSGDASTFNDSEGVLMYQIKPISLDGTHKRITLSDGTSNNRVIMGFDNNNNVIATVYDGSNQAILGGNYNGKDEMSKYALKYKENDFALWFNGFEVATDSSGITFPNNTLNQLKFEDGNGGLDFYGNTKQIQYYDSALTDSELETLTSWVSFSDMAEGQLYTIE